MAGCTRGSRRKQIRKRERESTFRASSGVKEELSSLSVCLWHTLCLCVPCGSTTIGSVESLGVHHLCTSLIDGKI